MDYEFRILLAALRGDATVHGGNRNGSAGCPRGNHGLRIVHVGGRERGWCSVEADAGQVEQVVAGEADGCAHRSGARLREP